MSEWTVLELEGPLAGLAVPILDTPKQLVEWAFEVWIIPEVTRRQEDGLAQAARAARRTGRP